MLHNVRISTFRSSFGDDFQYAPRTSTGAASSQLGGYAPNYYSMTTRVVSASSLARGLSTNNYSTWLLRLTDDVVAAIDSFGI
jgi:hypothetical protein